MSSPIFYQTIPKIKMHDPLSELLGSIIDGIIEFSFDDIVKVSGHGCPTVAGAYLAAFHGLRALYPDSIPTRGNIVLSMSGPEDIGVNGVIANVIGTIIGAMGPGGFKGLGGKYSRNNSVFFSKDVGIAILLTRKDTGKSIGISYHPEIVKGNSKTSELLGEILSNIATTDQIETFKTLWNERLEKILCNEFYNPELIKIVHY